MMLDSDNKLIFPIIKDDEFERDKVPMTKSSVRHLSIIRLGLTNDSVLYDIGSGTGSIAIEAAGLSHNIKVIAIEKKEEAISLIEKNKVKFNRDNVHIVSGTAPGIMKDDDTLPVPTHAFIGGSSGNMRDIMECLYNKNPRIKIVCNAISLETVSELTSLIKEYEEDCRIEDLIIEGVSVSRSKSIGNYHMMMGENPVYIVSFSFRG